MKSEIFPFVDRMGRNVLADRPAVMGIVNATNDSFFFASRAHSISEALSRIDALCAQGVAVIDIGGESTRPGAMPLNSEEEAARVVPLIARASERHPLASISIDTYKASVAEKAAHAGAAIVNDISGGTFDDEMFSVIVDLDIAYVLTHTKGRPSNMQENAQYDDVVREVSDFFETQLNALYQKGGKETRVMLDPGIGFGKTLNDNLALIRNVEYFRARFRRPILIGASRKRMIGDLLNAPVEERMIGSVAAHVSAAFYGADMLRAHDAKETREAITIFAAIERQQERFLREDAWRH